MSPNSIDEELPKRVANTQWGVFIVDILHLCKYSNDWNWLCTSVQLGDDPLWRLCTFWELYWMVFYWTMLDEKEDDSDVSSRDTIRPWRRWSAKWPKRQAKENDIERIHALWLTTCASLHRLGQGFCCKWEMESSLSLLDQDAFHYTLCVDIIWELLIQINFILS